MSNTTFTYIAASFKTLMEQTIGGYTEAETIDLSKKDSSPASTVDHAYSTLVQGMNSTKKYVNDEGEFSWNVRLQVSFEINQQDNKESYNQAWDAINEIITERLNYADYGLITNIEHISTSQLLPIVGNSFTFVYVNIDFRVDIVGTIPAV
jgi:hypothetical protein